MYQKLTRSDRPITTSRETTQQTVQLLSRVQLFATPWTSAHQASPSITNSQSLLKLTSIKSVMPFNHLILCRPLLLPPSIFPSIRVFPNESVLRIRWPKYWSFSFSISPSNEYSGLIFFRIDWLDLPAVQGTLKSILQHISKASILRFSAFFMVQLSHPYMTTGKTIALTRQVSVGKVMSLLFNMLSRLVIALLTNYKKAWSQDCCRWKKAARTNINELMHFQIYPVCQGLASGGQRASLSHCCFWHSPQPKNDFICVSNPKIKTILWQETITWNSHFSFNK